MALILNFPFLSVLVLNLVPGRGNITLSIVDVNGQVSSNNFPYHRLQPLAAPFISFANTSLSWAPANGKQAQPENNFMAKNWDDLKKKFEIKLRLF